ncbi:MAG: AEC family transporter [Deltaproteobacteria bacterium]|nr:AEC family transporter [Deltaproteobacteria bacterium]
MDHVVKQAFESVLTLFMLGLAGFYLVRRGWVNDAVIDFLPKLVVGLTLPLYLFSTGLKVLGKDDLGSLVDGTWVATLSMGATFLVSLFLVRLLKVRQGRKGLFTVGFSFSNTMFLGLPINVALFGDASLPYVMSYFVANSLWFWIAGCYLLSLDAPNPRPSRILSLDTAKKIFNPPLAGFLVAVFFIATGIKLPKFLDDSTSLLASTTVPLAIMYIGMGLGSLKLKSIRIDRDLLGVMSGRFFFCPLLTFLICLPFSVPAIMAQVFIIQASLPVLANSSIMAGYYRSDTSFAVLSVSLTTTLALITVPFFRVLVSFV